MTENCPTAIVDFGMTLTPMAVGRHCTCAGDVNGEVVGSWWLEWQVVVSQGTVAVGPNFGIVLV